MDLSTSFDGLMTKPRLTPGDVPTFLREMKKIPSGALVTSKLLASRIQSRSESEALRAFEFLESALEAEGEGSIEFRTEVGRFRFLNELIRILSPKYLGESTAQTVKDRGIRFLKDAAGSKRRKWFPSEHAKTQTVYQSLVEGGIIQPDPPSTMDPDLEFQKSIFERGENGILLKRLLSSKDPNDLQSANRLIKSLVEEESRRNERRSELYSLIDRIDTSTTLLTQLLTQPVIDLELIEELARNCSSLRLKLGDIGTETNEEVTALLRASETIETVLALHATKVKGGGGDELVKPLLELESEGQVPPGEKVELNSLLGSGTEDLLDLEGSLENLEFSTTTGVRSSGVKPEQGKTRSSFDEIERLSQELMQQSLLGTGSSKSEPKLPPSSSRGPTNTNKTLTLKELRAQKDHEQIKKTTLVNHPATASLLDLDFFEEPSGPPDHTHGNNQEDLVPVPSIQNGGEPPTTHPTENLLCFSQQTPPERSNLPPFHLNSVKSIELDHVLIKSTLKPITHQLVDGGNEWVTLQFSFGSYPTLPPSVKVMVLSLTHRHPTGSMFNYVFQLLPPRGTQVKVFPPSAAELSPWRQPFLLPPHLTQVALILSGGGQGQGQCQTSAEDPLPLKYIISYCLEEETALHHGNFQLPNY